MKKMLLTVLLLLSQFLAPFSASLKNFAFASRYEDNSFDVAHQPIYVRLQAMQDGNVVFSLAIPQGFQDHVATIAVRILGVLVSSNARGMNLFRDNVGNLWLTVNYTVKKGDYISVLSWVSSETVGQNLTIPASIPFPESYPENVSLFLNSGRKLPVNDTAVKEIAESYASEDMIETIENILDFINRTQKYDQEKVISLMSGTLTTTDILDFISDPLESLQTNSSFCFERALFATTLLRAARIPTRTFTNADLKTWVQVWLPNIGWVDAEVLCTQSQHLFPRPLSFTVPLMVENSSDAFFPFSWYPKVLMRISNLTLSNLETFRIGDYRTILSQPADAEMYETDPDKFSFPIIFDPEIVQAALTLNGTDVTFHLSKGEKKTPKTLVLGETTTIEFEGLHVSFEPSWQSGFIVLSNFSVYIPWVPDVKVLIPVVAIVPILIFWLYWRRRIRR